MDKKESAQWVLANELTLEDAWLKLICCDTEGVSAIKPDKLKVDVVEAEKVKIEKMMDYMDHSYDLCGGSLLERMLAQVIIMEAGVSILERT